MTDPDIYRLLHSLDDRTRNNSTKLDEIEESAKASSDRLTKAETHLGWHKTIGWGIAGAYAVVFGIVIYLMHSYIPDKFDDKLPSNFKEDWGSLKNQMKTIEERLNHLIPNTINDLLPASPKGTTEQLKANLQRASYVIDAAMKSEIPGDPDSLVLLRDRVRSLSERYGSDSEIRTLALSAEVRLDGYATGSKKLLAGKVPLTTSDAAEDFTKFSYLMNFTMSCVYPTARFLVATDLNTAGQTAVLNVTTNGCQQDLDGFKWMNVTFNGNTMHYKGGPLYLADVRFENVDFDFGKDERSQRALAVIKASNGKPVSLIENE